MTAFVDPWIPIGFQVGEAQTGRLIAFGDEWQLFEDRATGGRVLLVLPALRDLWHRYDMLPAGALDEVRLGTRVFAALRSGPSHVLASLSEMTSPMTTADGFAFATALRQSRECDESMVLADGIFVERFTRILPADQRSTYSDDVILGRYLTGGIPLSVNAGERFVARASWIPREQLAGICAAAGVPLVTSEGTPSALGEDFHLPGRPRLEAFFREHVLDIVENEDRYSALGIGFPGAILLHGPPGSGKTFAVQRLVDHLGWPCFEVSSSTIGSPYIHDTGRKIGALFEEAAKCAPSVVVIDEMDAFLPDRGGVEGSASYRVEEVAEFLRCVPRAASERVLVIGMTNRLDSLNPAMLRRGRFDHVVEVPAAALAEVEDLLVALLAAIPGGSELVPSLYSHRLVNRPLSDVAFVVREAGRLAARANRARIEASDVDSALITVLARGEPSDGRSVIGFQR